MSDAKEILVVVCSFSIEPIVLKEQLVKIGLRHGLAMRGVIVCNGQKKSELNDSKWSLIQGTNTDLDFSAYLQGANFWKEKLTSNHEVILFINDSLFAAHNAKANLDALLPLIPLLESIQLPAITGKVDRYLSVCHCNPWGGQHFYVSSYCFALNTRALATLQKLPKWADSDGLSHDTDIHDSNWAVGLQPAFREFLRINIDYTKSPYAWRSLAKYLNYPEHIRKKARCIYFEHRLSGQLAKDGCILPTNAGTRMQFKLYVREIFSRIVRLFLGQ